MELNKPYWTTKFDDLGWRDFNKEINHPGDNPKFIEGCVGIRTDDDFWVVAVVPYEYKIMDVQDIVFTLWPELKGLPPEDLRFEPDVIYAPEPPISVCETPVEKGPK